MAQEALEQSKLDQERQFEIILGLTANEKDSIDIFLKDFETLIASVKPIQSEKDIVEYVNDLFRKMHTLKGNSGSLGFKNLAKQAGAMEKTLATAQKTQAIPPDELQDWKQNYESLVSEYDYLCSMRTQLSGGSEEGLLINHGLYQTLLDHLKSQSSLEMRRLYQQVYDLNSLPLQKFCGKYQNIVQTFSEESGKKIAAIEFQDPDILVRKDVMHAFDPAIIHIIRNSIDHGFESNEEREQSGKGEGQILRIPCPRPERRQRDGRGRAPGVVDRHGERRDGRPLEDPTQR